MSKKIIVVLLTLTPFIADAQLKGILNKVKNKVENQVENRVDKKVDKQIEKTLDEIEGKNTSTPAAKPAADEANVAEPETGIKTFSKYDFIPGEKILYGDDFGQDAIGELPLDWNTGGKGEVVTINTFPGKWLRLYQNALYLTANKSEFTKNFTVEFDLILQLKNNGYTFPLMSFGILSSGEEKPNDNEFLNMFYRYQAAEVMIRPSMNGASYATLTTHLDRARYFQSQDQKLSDLDKTYSKVSHISMQVQETRLRVWLNGVKIFDIPKALPTEYIFNQLFFKIHSSAYKDHEIGFMIGNLKVATGIPDTRHKLIEEGKFSTTGILFDYQSAAIKPESYAVLKDIATVLKDNPTIKVKILGHTSSDGDDKANMELSRQRAYAVKEMLATEFSIDASRLETEGKGETTPIADNKTKEGKIANRRVEFVKQG
ncbi:MAG: OmpA family protein [Chitinophagaceae bacterium]|nr:OmpA family protein [Chitinophagaceae bacterium]